MENTPISFCMVICSRRRSTLITKALSSIAAQKIPDGVRFSVLVVENDTEPQYAEIIAKFQNKLTLHYETEPKPGLTFVRNHALNTAERLGFDWIGGIDDDVDIPEDWLVHMVGAIRTYPDTPIFYGNWIRHNHPDEPKWHPEANHYNKYPTGRRIQVSSFNNIAVRADVISQSGMGLRFDHRFRFIGGEDTDFTRSYLKKGGIIRSVHEALAEEYNDLDRASLSARMRRVSGEQYSLTTIRHKHDLLIVALFWSCQRVYRDVVFGTINIGAGILAMPFNKDWGLARYVAGKRQFAGATGVLQFYFGPKLELYRDTDS